jgi:hypothetical protein
MDKHAQLKIPFQLLAAQSQGFAVFKNSFTNEHKDPVLEHD